MNELLGGYIRKEFPGWPFSKPNEIGDFGAPERSTAECLVCNAYYQGWYITIFTPEGNYSRRFVCDGCSIHLAMLWLHMSQVEREFVLSTTPIHRRWELHEVFGFAKPSKNNDGLLVSGRGPFGERP